MLQGHIHMLAVKQAILGVEAEIQETKKDIAGAEQEKNDSEVDFPRGREKSLRAELCSLVEQQTMLLRAQALGQHSLPCQNWLVLHKSVCAHCVTAHFSHCAVPLP